MKITLPCKACKTYYAIRPSEERSKAICPKCSTEISVTISESLLMGTINTCAICGRDKFYARKEFNRKLGLTLVFIGILLSIYYTYYHGFLGVLVLMVIATLDWIISYFLPWMAVCYACRAEYKGFKRNPEHKAFDLKIQEQYGKY
jgi:hypothetical protein